MCVILTLLREKMEQFLMKKEFVWMKNKKLIIMMFAIPLVISVCFIAASHIQEKNVRKQQIDEQEAELEARRKEEQEKAEKIEQALQSSAYGEDLRKLYEEYPQMEEMLLQLELYTDEIIEYLLKIPEAVDYVISYPTYTQMSEGTRRQLAQQPLVLSDYEMHEGVPVYYQWDSRWGYTSYGDVYLAISGCAPTCLSMAAVALTGDLTITPRKVADISEEMGAYVYDVGTSWELMTTGAEKLGLKSRQIEKWSVQAIRSSLEEGKIVICSMGEGDFTTQGHFILIVGETEDGRFLVNDPNSKANTEKEWEGKVLLEQMKAMWALSL